jgi:hypothetical protein
VISEDSDGKEKDILWADIAQSCEYNQKDGAGDLDNVRIISGALISCAS